MPWVFIILPSSSPSWGVACSVLLLPQSQSVTFTVAVLPANESALKTQRGVTNGLVMEHANGAGTPLVTAVAPGATLTNVALFIDSSKEALRPMAEEKDWWCALLPLHFLPGMMPVGLELGWEVSGS